MWGMAQSRRHQVGPTLSERLQSPSRTPEGDAKKGRAPKKKLRQRNPEPVPENAVGGIGHDIYILGQQVRASCALWDEYQTMKKANWKLSDKYFHCLAHCKATKEGPGGATVSRAVGEGRELVDEYLKGDSRAVCDQDRAANSLGRTRATNPQYPSCTRACDVLRPDFMPEYP